MSNLSQGSLPLSSLERPGSPLSLDSRFYIYRPPVESLACQEIEKPGSLLRIKATRKMGKSSLLNRIITHAEKKSYNTASINFQVAEADLFSSLDSFLRWLCTNISHQVQITPQLDEYWVMDMGSKVNCTLYLETHLLDQLEQPLALFLDDIHRLFAYPDIAQDVLGLLRFWHEQSKKNLSFQKLRLILTYTTDIYAEFEINQSPFNIGQILTLPKLTLAQVQALASYYQLNQFTHPPKLEKLKTLIELVGGHPYLIQLALYQLAQKTHTLSQLIEEAPTAVSIYSSHLRQLLYRLRQDILLATAFQQIVMADTPIPVDDLLAFKLSNMGLVNLHQNGCQIACELYRAYFSSQTLLPKETLENRLEQLTQENQDLKVLVHIDGLTQIANRRHFDHQLHTEWQRLIRNNKPLALIMCDIDFFKEYNNTYGHPRGDICLRQVATTIRNTLKRPTDTAARYGGEEFIVLLPETDIKGAVYIAQQIQEAIRCLKLPHASTTVKSGQITLSIGVAALVPDIKIQPTELVQAADDALYQSKRQGRNCITVNSDLGWDLQQ